MMNPSNADLREPAVLVLLIDSRGMITGIQTHGGEHTGHDDPRLDLYAVGDSYFNHCDDDARDGIHALLKRVRTLISFVIPPRANKARHTFVVVGVPVSPEIGSGAVLMHVDISDWARPETQNFTVQETLSKSFSHLSEPQRSYQPRPDIESLSPRQLEVLTLIASGKSNQEIAEELSCSLNTVKRHVTAVLQKLNLPNRTRAANLANQLNLVAPSGRRR